MDALRIEEGNEISKYHIRLRNRSLAGVIVFSAFFFFVVLFFVFVPRYFVSSICKLIPVNLL